MMSSFKTILLLAVLVGWVCWVLAPDSREIPKVTFLPENRELVLDPVDIALDSLIFDLGTLVSPGAAIIKIPLRNNSRYDRSLRLRAKSCACVNVPDVLEIPRGSQVYLTLEMDPSINQFRHYVLFDDLGTDETFALDFEGRILPQVFPIQYSSNMEEFSSLKNAFVFNVDMSNGNSMNRMGLVVSSSKMVEPNQLSISCRNPVFQVVRNSPRKLSISGHVFDVIPVSLRSDSSMPWESSLVKPIKTDITSKWVNNSAVFRVEIVGIHHVESSLSSVFLSRKGVFAESVIELRSKIAFNVTDIVFDKSYFKVEPITDSGPSKRFRVALQPKQLKHELVQSNIEFVLDHPQQARKVINIYSGDEL